MSETIPSSLIVLVLTPFELTGRSLQSDNYYYFFYKSKNGLINSIARK